MRVVSYRSASFSPTALSYGTGLLYSLPQRLAEHWASHFYDTSRRNFFGENEIERKLDRMMEELTDHYGHRLFSRQGQSSKEGLILMFGSVVAWIIRGFRP